MGLFTKKESKNYIVFDPYSEEAVATCTSSEVKQILSVQSKAQFVECTQFEMFKFKEHGMLPDDITMRKRLGAREVK